MYGLRQTVGIHSISRTDCISGLNFHEANWKSICEGIDNQNWPDSLSIQDNDLKLCPFMSTVQAICT